MNKKCYEIKYFSLINIYYTNKIKGYKIYYNNKYLNKTVIIKNLDFYRNGQIGIIKNFDGFKFKIKLITYNSLKSKNPIFIYLNKSNIEIL